MNSINEFHKRICHFYSVKMTVGDRGFQYRIRINTEEHFMHISYKLVYASKTRKNTLRIEAYPKSLVYFRYWLEQIRDYANEILFVRCDVAFDIPFRINDLFKMSTKGRKLRLFKGTRYYNGKHQRQEMAIVGCMTRSVNCRRQDGKKFKESKRGWRLYMPRRGRYRLLHWFSIRRSLTISIYVLCLRICPSSTGIMYN